MAQSKREVSEVDPDKRKLTQKQARYLSTISKMPVKELADRTLAEITDITRWKIDPQLLFHRRVCGRVVKTDPETGEKYGVPNATVHVEDTDCNFLVYGPKDLEFLWLFPWNCSREVIATVKTDECGNFCVWVPIFDIDRVLRFRRERLCIPDLVHLDICELLNRKGIPCPPVEMEYPFPKIPRPIPDPAPIMKFGVRDLLKELAGPEQAERLELLMENRQFGATTRPLQSALHAPALKGKMPPPLPAEIRELKDENQLKTMSFRASVSTSHLREINFQNYIGPFHRCFDVLIPEWTTVLDVPDITFRVTQDVDGDGAEETIYSEGYFDVRWNTTDIPDVELEADGSALASPFCGEPEIDADCTSPTLLAAGLMPLDSAYHNASTGYALRPNRPRHEAAPHQTRGFHDSPIIVEPSQAPYCMGVPLFACHRIGNAQYYRLMYAYESASEVPFTGETWVAPAIGTPTTILFAPDGDGWYPIIPEAQLVHPHWVFYWRTWRFPNGKYTLRLQIGDSGKNVIDQSASVAFVIDNRRATAIFDQIDWRVSPGGTWHTLPENCPVLHRPKGTEIEFRVTYTTSAVHFRDIQLTGFGCGLGGLNRVGDMTNPVDRSRFEHWYTHPGDNTLTRTGHFTLPAVRPQGVYGFHLNAHTRAFNPAGGMGGPSSDWYFDMAQFHTHPSRNIAVVDV